MKAIQKICIKKDLLKSEGGLGKILGEHLWLTIQDKYSNSTDLLSEIKKSLQVDDIKLVFYIYIFQIFIVSLFNKTKACFINHYL